MLNNSSPNQTAICPLTKPFLFLLLLSNRKSPRKEIVLNVDKDDSLDLWSAVIIKGKFKLIWGKPSLLKIQPNTRVRAEETCPVGARPFS